MISRTRPRHAATGILTLFSVMALAGCSALDTLTGDSSPDTPATAAGDGAANPYTEQIAEPVRGTELPVEEAAVPAPPGTPEGTQACPYIDSVWLENTTGQKFTGVGLDERFDPPACVFWSFEDVPQATVLVRKMTNNADAVAVVDSHAPIDATLKAQDPQGWSGGRRGGDETSGALYAVWKDEKAVVVHTNQDQSIKAQQIAEETIRNLGL